MKVLSYACAILAGLSVFCANSQASDGNPLRGEWGTVTPHSTLCAKDGYRVIPQPSGEVIVTWENASIRSNERPRDIVCQSSAEFSVPRGYQLAKNIQAQMSIHGQVHSSDDQISSYFKIAYANWQDSVQKTLQITTDRPQLSDVSATLSAALPHAGSCSEDVQMTLRITGLVKAISPNREENAVKAQIKAVILPALTLEKLSCSP